MTQLKRHGHNASTILLQERNLTQTKPWYGEMYAYTLATAEAGVNHLASNSTVFHMRYYHPHGELLSCTSF